jgi:uncharacterized protein YbdZ (MbtH family)
MLTTRQSEPQGWQFQMQLQASGRRMVWPEAGDIPAPWLTEEEALHAGLDRARLLIDQSIRG